MKRILQLIFFLIIPTFNLYSQAVSFDWAHTIGAGSETCGYTAVTDASGNIYTVGTFTGRCNFAPTGTSVLSSNGKKDIFIQFLSPAGALIWAKNFGGIEDDIPTSVCMSGGFLFITGTFQGTFSAGALSVTAVGQTDVFILKVSSSGSVFNLKSIGSSGTDIGNSISSAGTGILCMTGSFEGFVDMDPSVGGTSFATSAGLHDIFIETFDLNLNFLWEQTIGGTGEDYGKSITSDASGNIYTTGSFEGTIDMDPGLSISNFVSNGANDVFIEKLNSSGNFMWATITGDTGNDEGTFIKIDASGNVFVMGDFSDTPDFDPGTLSYPLSSSGGKDIFMQKLDGLGNFVSAFAEGGTADDYGNAFTFDASGNIYCTGTFQNSVDFDPGVGVSSVTSSGLSDIFIQKTDPSFNFLFINALQGTDDGGSNFITTDATGNIYTTGCFIGTVDFDPGAATVNLQAGAYNKYYIHKLNNTGIYQWVKSISIDASSMIQATSVTTDIYGNSYNTGFFQFCADLDPGPGSFIFQSLWQNTYVQKLDPLGNLVWALNFQTAPGTASYNSKGCSITTDSLGNVYVAGYFDVTTDLDPGPTVFNVTPPASGNVFLEKIDASGNMIWVKTFAGYGIYEQSTVIDKTGNVYFTGALNGTADLDPGPGIYNLSSTGIDIYVCKLDQSGNFLWAKKVGGVADESGSEIVLDSNDQPLIFGSNSSATDINPGTGMYYLPDKGNFILKMDNFGNFLWIKGIQESSNVFENIFAMKLDKLNNIYFTGSFSAITSSPGTMDFDPGLGVFNMTTPAFNDDDVYIEKLDDSGNFLWAKSFGSTDTDYPNDIDLDIFGNVYVTGIYHNTIDFDPGPFIHNVTCSPSAENAFIEKLNSNGDFVWVQSTSALATNGFFAASISIDRFGSPYIAGYFARTGDLNPTSGTYSVTSSGANDGFILKLDQCFINSIQTQTSCNSYTYNGATYTSSGTYGQVLGTSFLGCDSTITLDVTINAPINTVTQSGNVLTANQSGAAYQWINCGTNTPISGENLQNYSVAASGNYAVEINLSGCIDTSACIPFVFTEISSIQNSIINVYPSPFQNNFTLEYYDNKHQSIHVEIGNILGQIVFKGELISDSKQQIFLNDIQSGTYIIKIYDGHSFAQKYIIKE